MKPFYKAKWSTVALVVLATWLLADFAQSGLMPGYNGADA
tara:strand:- start:1216 stop:1335 length:120 start_codon:yes stop_codon:yes gene_type:complete